MTGVAIVTTPLGGGPLTRAAIAGDARVGAWYAACPRTVDEWRARARAVAGGHAGRNWLEPLAPALRADGAAAARIARVAGAGGVVVSTGQQAALFGGPAYTLNKALAALALANTIEAHTGVAAAPVFWAATDDADFAEAASVFVAMSGGAKQLALRGAPSRPEPMSAVPLAGIEPLIADLEAASGTAADATVLELVRNSFVDGATIGDAYVGLLRGLLHPLGIAVLDASHPALRAAAMPVLRRALERAEEVDSALAERDRTIADAGFETQVERIPGLSLVFDSAGGAKQRIPASESSRVLADAGAVLSANVLLRPIVERTLMPSIAYLGGPGEIAYFAQLSAAADALGAETPLIVPRWSGLVIEPRIARILDSLGTSVGELRTREALETRLARDAMPTAISAAMERLRTDLTSDVDTLARASAELVPGPVVEGARRSVTHRLERLERRLTAAVKRRATETMRDIGTAHGSLFPGGVPQERSLSFVPFRARYGAAYEEACIAAATEHARALVGGSAVGSSSTFASPANRSDLR